VVLIVDYFKIQFLYLLERLRKTIRSLRIIGFWANILIQDLPNKNLEC